MEEIKKSNWYKENWVIILVMILAIAIRIYYFWITRNSAEWWDSLCYGSLAKNMVMHLWDGTAFIAYESALRPLMFSAFWSMLLMLGANELVCRILLVLIPSILNVLLVYLVAKELFNKRVGLISAVIFSSIWMNLFYSSRFLVHEFELMFLILSMYLFIKATKEELNISMFCWALFSLSIATLIRYQAALLFFVYLLYLILGRKLYLNKIKFWIYSFAGTLPLSLFLLFNYINTGTILPALGMNPGVETPIAWGISNFIPQFLLTIFFITFLIGSLYMIFELFIHPIRNSKFRNIVLVMLAWLIFLYFLIFYIRVAEDRWLFEILISISIISAYGIEFIAGILEKYGGKILGVSLIVVLLFLGVYAQLQYASPLIHEKKDTYSQMKVIFESIKANTPEGSVIAGYGIEPYAIYYSERKYIGLTTNSSDIELLPYADYLVVHVFNPVPQYIVDYLNNQTSFVPIASENMNFMPAVVLYQNTGERRYAR